MLIACTKEYKNHYIEIEGGEIMSKTECAVCMKVIKVLEEFNGEMMCEECYNDPENEVFTDG